MPSLVCVVFGLALAISFLPSIQCTPHHRSTIQPRSSAVDCHNPNDDFDVSCWQELGLTDWLKNWTYNICDPHNRKENKADCCNPAWEWSTCFLKLGIKTGYNCTTISQDTCAFSPLLRDEDLAPSILPQVRYVLLNIFYVHAFFNDWYTAVNNAAGTPASSIIDAIVQEVDPEVKTKFLLGDVLSALSAGLAFIPGVGVGASTAANVATKAIVLGVQQAPGVAKAIWPSGTANSQAIQISSLKQELENVSSTLKDRMNAGLHEVMFNKTSFANFASSGLFSGADAPSIAENEDAMTMGLRTFILTRALTANKWAARVYPEGVKTWFFNKCFPNSPYPSSTIFPYCWYNATTERAYELFNLHHEAMAWELMDDIITKQWAYPPFMFEATVECAARGGFGDDSGGGLIGFRDDRTLDMTCLSKLDTCTTWARTEHAGDDWTVAPSLTGLVNGGCPVRTCQGFERGS